MPSQGNARTMNFMVLCENDNTKAMVAYLTEMGATCLICSKDGVLYGEYAMMFQEPARGKPFPDNLTTEIAQELKTQTALEAVLEKTGMPYAILDDITADPEIKPWHMADALTKSVLLQDVYTVENLRKRLLQSPEDLELTIALNHVLDFARKALSEKGE